MGQDLGCFKHQQVQPPPPSLPPDTLRCFLFLSECPCLCPYDAATQASALMKLNP